MIVKLTAQDREQFNQLLESFTEKHKETKTTNEVFVLNHELNEAIRSFYKQIENREFSQLAGDHDKIMKSAEEQVNLLIDDRCQDCEKWMIHRNDEEYLKYNPGSVFGIRIDGDDFYLDIDSLIKECKEDLLVLHYEALSADQDAVDQLDSLVFSIISENPKTSSDKGKLIIKSRLSESFDISSAEQRELEQILVHYPSSYIMAIDKVSNETFLGDFQPGTGKKVNVQKKKLAKKSPIYTLIYIDIAELEGVKISGRKELTAFDREVHDAIVTLYVEGENVFITVNMIYQMMTGKKDAHCSPKQAQAISDSITKLMLAHVIIDASEEAKLRGFKTSHYDSTLINIKRNQIVLMNGKEIEAIKILDTPILFDYAQQKNQIGRFDVKLLDSPVNKTEENIILEGYLRRRILGIKGSSKLSPTIVYETIYKQLEISASSDGALRKKKLKVRETVKRILDFYIQEKFIKGYCENTHKAEKNKIDSVTIRY